MSRRLPHPPSEQGFTLVEVMIAMFFLSIMISGTLGVSTYATRINAHSRRLTSATLIAEQQLERCRNIAYDNLNIDMTSAVPPGKTCRHNDPFCFDRNMTEISCADPYMFKQTTGVTGNTPLNNVSQVEITVSWDDIIAPHEVRLVTSIAKY